MKAQKTLNLSVVIPISNEEGVVVKQIDEIEKILTKSRIINDYEIILVENGSRDDTPSVMSKFKTNNRIIIKSLKHSSYGSAIKLGILHTKYPYGLLMPIDWIDPNFIQKGLVIMSNNKDVVMVIGDKKNKNSNDNRSKYKKFQSKLWSTTQQYMFPNINCDTHGLKIIRLTTFVKRALIQTISKEEFVEVEWIHNLISQDKMLKKLPVCVEEIRNTNYSLSSKLIRVSSDIVRLIVKRAYQANKEKGVIVMCDDYGISQESSQWMHDAVKTNLINGISVLPTHIKKEDVAQLNSLDTIFSWHLNLTEGKPLCNPKQIPSLINQEGDFYPFPLFLIRLILGITKLSEIKTEITEQYCFFQRNNVNVTHIAGHWHIHLIPQIDKVLEEKFPQLEKRPIKATIHSLSTKPIRWLIFMTFLMPLYYLLGLKPSSAKKNIETIVHYESNN